MNSDQHLTLLMIQFRRAGVVSDTHKIVLMLLKLNPDGIGTRDMVRLLKMNFNSSGKVIAQLLAKGMISKEQKGSHLHAKITPKGLEVVTVEGAPE